MYLSELARNLSPYIAGEQKPGQRFIKLNTNENPYPPSPRALCAIEEAKETLRLYPDADALGLSQAIARVNGVQTENVFCANGSDEALAFAFAAFFAGKTLVAPDVTYSFYPTYAKLFDINYVTVPLGSDFAVDVRGLMRGASIVLSNPNAPTGRLLELGGVRTLAAHCHQSGCVLLVDEAYAAFAKENALALLKEFDNLLIVRTFSKSHSLAGMRVGYALGSEALIQGLRRVKDSFNSYPLDSLAQAVAREAILDTAYTAEITQKVIEARAFAKMEMEKLGLTVIPSDTNFLFVKADEKNAAWVKERLMEQGILVRHFEKERIAPYLRISIGTLDDMKKTVQTLAFVLEKGR